MKRFSGIVCLILCVSACFSVPICEYFDEDGCRVTSEQIYDDVFLPQEPSKFEPEVGVNKVNELLYSSPDVTIVLPRLPDTPEEDPEKGFETRPSAQPAKTALEKDVDKLMTLVKDQDNRIKELESSRGIFLKKLDQIEQETKVNNLIFTNVREKRNESHKATLQIVLNILNRVMKVRSTADDIAVALRASSNSSSVEVRPIVVTFRSFATKMRVIAARSRLKSTNIEVSVDYSELVTQRRKDLVPFLLEKRSLGHNAFILYDQLVVDGVRVSLEDLKAERKNTEAEDKEDEGRLILNPWYEENPFQGGFEDELDEEVEQVEVSPQFNEFDRGWDYEE